MFVTEDESAIGSWGLGAPTRLYLQTIGEYVKSIDGLDSLLNAILHISEVWDDDDPPDDNAVAWNDIRELSLAILILDQEMRLGNIPTRWRTSGPE